MNTAFGFNANNPENLNRYVKVKGHTNWFLVLEANQGEPESLSELMQEKMLRSYTCLHNPEPLKTQDEILRLQLVATREIYYESLAIKYGTILIRPIGSFMPLRGNEITEETFDTDFPITEFSEIVICENDNYAEFNWKKFLQKKYPNKRITVINYFDLRSENEVKQYFDNAKIITFSTTFSNFDWFKKLTKFTKENHEIIGYCHDKNKWKEALEINPNVKVIESI
jgi:hypothetical protein